jgi:Fic family protein
MDLQRAESIISFIKGLTPDERTFVRQIVQSSIEKKKKRPEQKKNGKYSDEQIKKAWELLKKGLTGKEIGRITKIKANSISKTFLKERMQNIKKKE